MDSQTVVQILGVIVQSYAGILAIGAGFFTFMVQRFRDELKYAEEKIQRNIDIIAEAYVQNELYQELVDFKVGAIEQGTNWIKEELNKVHKKGQWLCRLQLSNGQKQALKNLETQYPNYQKLKERSERMPYKLFTGFLLFCSFVIILSLTIMGLVDFIVEVQFSNLTVWSIEFVAAIGIAYVAFFGWRIATIFK